MGPGLKETVYEECMILELKGLDISFEQQFRFRPVYKGIQLKTTSVIDLLVEDRTNITQPFQTKPDLEK